MKKLVKLVKLVVSIPAILVLPVLVMAASPTTFGDVKASATGLYTNAAGNIVEQDSAALPRVIEIEARTNSWNQAFGWGDHSLVGYLTSFIEQDPAWAAVSNSVQAGADLGATALQAEADTFATVTGRGGTTTKDVTIGSRGMGDVGVSSFANGDSVVASGDGSHAEGSYTTASGDYSHAEGDGTTASGDYSHASGFNSGASDITAFAWQGTDGGYSEPTYESHGPGTYNLNPVGGLAGLWIGETTLDALLNERATWQGATNIAEGVASSVCGPRLSLIEAGTNSWNQAFGWGDHSLMGYASTNDTPVAVSVTEETITNDTHYITIKVGDTLYDIPARVSGN